MHPTGSAYVPLKRDARTLNGPDAFFADRNFERQGFAVFPEFPAPWQGYLSELPFVRPLVWRFLASAVRPDFLAILLATLALMDMYWSHSLWPSRRIVVRRRTISRAAFLASLRL